MSGLNFTCNHDLPGEGRVPTSSAAAQMYGALGSMDRDEEAAAAREIGDEAMREPLDLRPPPRTVAASGQAAAAAAAAVAAAAEGGEAANLAEVRGPPARSATTRQDLPRGSRPRPSPFAPSANTSSSPGSSSSDPQQPAAMARSALTEQQQRASSEPLTPFAAFATSAAALGGSPKQWPRAGAFPRGAPPQLLRSPFLGSDMSSAAVAIPRLRPDERQGSLHGVPSLTDWASAAAAAAAAAAAGATPGGHSAERLPSLHDWMLPMLGPRSSSSGSLPKPLPPLFGQPIPEASAAQERPPDTPPHRRPAMRRRSHDGGSGSRDESDSGNALGASPPFLGSWRSTAPRSPGRHAAGVRGASVSPKRGRNSLDEDVFVGSFDDAPQPQKSPRLGGRGCSQAPEAPARSGSLTDSGPGFAELHAVINTMWNSTGDASRVAGAESTRVG